MPWIYNDVHPQPLFQIKNNSRHDLWTGAPHPQRLVAAWNVGMSLSYLTAPTSWKCLMVALNNRNKSPVLLTFIRTFHFQGQRQFSFILGFKCWIINLKVKNTVEQTLVEVLLRHRMTVFLTFSVCNWRRTIGASGISRNAHVPY